MAPSLLSAGAILAVLVVLHAYVRKRLVADVVRTRSWWYRAGTGVTLLLLVATVGTMVTGPGVDPSGVVGVGATVGETWLGVLAYLVPLLLLGEMVRPLLRRVLARRAARSPGTRHGEPGPTAEDDADLSRRLFIARGVGAGAALAATTLLSYGEVMDRRKPAQQSGVGAGGVEVALPFAGRWRVQNSPARRVPSHGTDLFGGRYAIDFVAVDGRNRTADSRSWRTFVATEPPEMFFAFGQPIVSPGTGTVVAAHDGEVDHEARRSQLALVPYALGQAGRAGQGVSAIAGNHVIISLEDSAAFVALVHLRAGSLRVAVGDTVVEGQHLADCGNSGNSTQPHVHMQVMDSADVSSARGVPMLFRRFRERPSETEEVRVRERAVPGEGAVVEEIPPR